MVAWEGSSVAILSGRRHGARARAGRGSEISDWSHRELSIQVRQVSARNDTARAAGPQKLTAASSRPATSTVLNRSFTTGSMAQSVMPQRIHGIELAGAGGR